MLLRYRLLARRTARDIEDLRRAGVRVLGVVGGGSPSCGANATLDLREAFEIVASCPLARIDRATVNERVVIGCRTLGEGLFTGALERELARRGIVLRSWTTTSGPAGRRSARRPRRARTQTSSA